MSDHFYSMNIGDVFNYAENTITVDTSTTSGSKIELRITDGSLSLQQAYEFCEKLADMFATNDPLVVAAGSTSG